MSADSGTNGAKGRAAEAVVAGAGSGPVAPGSQVPPPVKVIEIYPATPDDEVPPPSFRQALVGYGSIILGLVLLGVLLGVLMRVLR